MKETGVIFSDPIYRADFDLVESPAKDIKKTAWHSDGRNGSWSGYFLGSWKPSIHMPRKICRFVGELVEIRLERLQDITEEDAKAEGVYWYGEPRPGVNVFKDYLMPEGEDIGVSTAVLSFQTLWASIHSIDSFLENPWVWVLEYKKV